ncbi:MAG TPA: tRNA lysidine(34) synthetase TilS [bacterium]|nr:tRNA lysidine(34) synthetase TilS [bacterium]
MTFKVLFRYFIYMDTLFRRVLTFAANNSLFSPGERLLIAVSGGADSTFLLHFLASVAPEKKIRLRVAYIHHHLRPEADRELEFVKKLCLSRSLPFSCRHLHLPNRSSLENQARLARYAALAGIARQTRCQAIATGHTLDDQAETVLMRILRGCGLAGLRGILPFAPCLPRCPVPVVRPLLVVTRQEIEKFLREKNLPFLQDASNFSPEFFRNKIRHEIIPFLEKSSPRLKYHLARTSLLARDDFQILEREAESAKTCLCRKEKNRLFLDRRGYLLLPAGIQRLLLSLILCEITGCPYRRFSQLETIRQIISLGKQMEFSLPNSLKLTVKPERVIFAKKLTEKAAVVK